MAFIVPAISHLQNVVYLVGFPISHSSSPALHDAISSTIGLPYAQVLVETTDLVSFLTYLRNTHPETPKLLGSGITMPHKVDVIKYLDHLTPEAQAIGAVNTIFFRSDPQSGVTRFWGTNTDCIGIRDAFLNNVPLQQLEAYRGKPGLVVGSGGTCRTAIFALRTYFGCSKVYIINRLDDETDAVLSELQSRNLGDGLLHIRSLSQAGHLEPPSLIVSAIPDFTPSTEGELLVRSLFSHFLQTRPEKGVVLEMCYHPSPNTQITALATSCGWQVIPGIEAMIGQGLEQAKLWTGTKMDSGVRIAARKFVTKRE